MAPIHDQDPYHWDTDTLVNFLCKSGTPLTKDPNALAKILREEEFDGQTFLQYAAQRYEQLVKVLQLGRVRQDLALMEILDELRSKSPAYFRWADTKLATKRPAISAPWSASPAPSLPLHTSMGQASPALSASHYLSNAAHGLASHIPGLGQLISPPEPSANDSTGNNAVESLNNGVFFQSQDIQDSVAKIALDTHDQHAPIHHADRRDPQMYNHDDSHIPTKTQTRLPADVVAAQAQPVQAPMGLQPAPLASHSVTGDQDAREPTKRRRIAPVNVQQQPVSSHARQIRPEDDIFGDRVPDVDMRTTSARTLETEPESAYLGRGFLLIESIRSSTELLSTRLTELPGDSFVVQGVKNMPRGRQMVIKRVLYQHLKKTSQQVEALRTGYRISSSAPTSEYEDTVVDWDDLPEEYDEETLREIAEEENERAANQITDLQREDIEKILAEFVEEKTVQWTNEKLPKYERRAHKLWKNSRKRGERKFKIQSLQHILHGLDARLHKLSEEIAGQKWQKSSEVRRQAQILDQTLEDRLRLNWELSVLNSRYEPPRPESFPRTRRPPARQKDNTLEDDGELLVSSDDEDDFIVPDTSDAADPFDESIELHDFTDLPSGIVLSSPRPTEERQDSGVASDASDFNFQIDVKALRHSKARDHFDNSDRYKALVSLLWGLQHVQRQAVFRLVQDRNAEEIWDGTIEMQLAQLANTKTSAKKGDDGDDFGAYHLLKLFLMFSKNQVWRTGRLAKKLGNHQIHQELRANRSQWFPCFITFLKNVAPNFPQDDQIFRHDALLEVEEESDEELLGESSRGQAPGSGRPARRIEVVQDREAMNLRARDVQRQEELEQRKAKLRERLAHEPFHMSQEESRRIINEGKAEDEGFVYIDEEIGHRIKPHQIEGVRFLWNQLVRDGNERSGGLLAHTMGLGKTMQVITLLIALQDAARSKDLAVSRQIPADLKHNHTLIICPAGLVANWIDELLTWDSHTVLEPLRKIESDLTPAERELEIQRWAQGTGVLVIGYEMLKTMFSRATEETKQLLRTTPNIVVADEAHRLKNAKSEISRICSQFDTRSRVALTGSPLANNVEEYYEMINWVAEGYLADRDEFRQTYARPIVEGLYHDSAGFEKRQAIKMLRVLSGTVAPKVHRATIEVMKNDLPNKHEFVISVLPTQKQKGLYDACVLAIKRHFTSDSLPWGQMWAVLELLRLICNHPKCLHQKVIDAKESRAEKEHLSLLTEAISPIVTKWAAGEDLMDESLSTKMTLLTQVLDEARKAGDKVLVFTSSIPTMDYLEMLFTRQKRQHQRLDGSTQVSKRQEAIKAFNSSDAEIYLISTKAGGVGLNIQGANRVVIFDFKFNPVDEQQAIGRAYRIGQQKTVYVYRFVLAGSFEDDLHNKAVFKTQLASRVVDKKNTVRWSKRGGDLFHEFKVPRKTALEPFIGKDATLDTIIKSEVGQIITSIISTDTFEEEELDELTVAERDEADQLIHVNRLRLVDPIEYERQRARLDVDRLQSQRLAMAPSFTSVMASQGRPSMDPKQSNGRPIELHLGPPPSTAPQAEAPSFNQSLDGAGDTPDASARFPIEALASSSVHGPIRNYRWKHAIPQPIPGANTYFGRREAATSSPREQQPGVSSTSLSPPVTTSGNPFEQPLSREKGNFTKKLTEKLTHFHRNRKLTLPAEPEVFAHQLTEEIHRFREEANLGFLPNNERWRELTTMLDRDRIVMVIAMKRVSTNFLALSGSDDLNPRMNTLCSDLSMEETNAMARGKVHNDDPTVRQTIS